jgi:hypothetical protein
VIRPYPIIRSDSASVRLPLHLGSPQIDLSLSSNNRAIVKERILRLARILFPSLIALTLTTAAHAQGTMDFSGAQTLMGTFKAKNPLILGFQGKAQLEMIYGHLAEVMLS